MEPILSGSEPFDLDLCWGKSKEQEFADEGSKPGSPGVACDLGPITFLLVIFVKTRGLDESLCTGVSPGFHSSAL